MLWSIDLPCCVMCGEPLTRNRRTDGQIEPPAALLKRKTCSGKCQKDLMHQQRAVRHELRHCKLCGNELVRKQLSDRREDNGNFRKRQTCGHACIGKPKGQAYFVATIMKEQQS